MRGFQCFLLCALLYTASIDAFGTCTGFTDASSCPDNSACVEVTQAVGSNPTVFECKCEAGFDTIDIPDLTIEGRAATVCVDLGSCTPFDNKEDDCVNGQCVVYKDKYELYQAVCKCDDGFYGEKCDSTTQQSGSGIMSVEVVLLALLAGGAAVLSFLM